MACDSQFTLPEYIQLTELDTISIMNGDDDTPFIMTTPPLEDDATLDSPMQFAALHPEQIMGPPDRSLMQNIHNFTVEISSTDTNKKKYLYSCQLNKVYVDMNCDFAVQFSWQNLLNDRLYVRATVVFSDKDQSEKRVERCMQHRHENTDISEVIRMNVLRSSREIGTSGVTYHGDPSRADSWYSLRVEFANSAQTALHAFKFVCKNSCSSGINRRAIAIIFTLEDVHGNVFGRQLVGVRVCACPRRDLLKDEETEGVKLKRPAAREAVPKTKKVKLEPNTPDCRVYNLPNLQVVGANTLATGLEMMVRMMEQGMISRAEDPQYIANCTSSIATLKSAIQQYRKNSGTD